MGHTWKEVASITAAAQSPLSASLTWDLSLELGNLALVMNKDCY